jgi:hypothetical protein
MSESKGDWKRDLEQFVADLQATRDELRVKLHLAKQDAKAEWAELEKKLDGLKGRMDVVGKEAGRAAKDVGAALKVVAEEIRKGYERIKRVV